MNFKMTYYLNTNPTTYDIPLDHNGCTYLFRKEFPHKLIFLGKIDRYVFSGVKKEMKSAQWETFKTEAIPMITKERPTPKNF
jgi:hypothetical protein